MAAWKTTVTVWLVDLESGERLTTEDILDISYLFLLAGLDTESTAIMADVTGEQRSKMEATARSLSVQFGMSATEIDRTPLERPVTATGVGLSVR